MGYHWAVTWQIGFRGGEHRGLGVRGTTVVVGSKKESSRNDGSSMHIKVSIISGDTCLCSQVRIFQTCFFRGFFPVEVLKDKRSTRIHDKLVVPLLLVGREATGPDKINGTVLVLAIVGEVEGTSEFHRSSNSDRGVGGYRKILGNF